MRFAALICILFFTGWLNSQEKINLSYDLFISKIITNNPTALRANNIGIYGKLKYKAALGNYDPFVSGNFENKYFSSKNYYQIVGAELKQPLFTSQYFKLGYEYAQGNFVNPENATSNFGLPFLGFEMSLLQGLVIDKRRAEVLKSKNYKLLYDAEKNNLINGLLFEASLSYFDWLYTNKQLALNSYFIELATKRLNGIIELVNVGERPSVDTTEAAILIQNRELDLQSAQIDNLKLTANLNNYFWQSFNDATSKNNFENIDSLDAYYDFAKKLILNLFSVDSITNPIISFYKAKGSILGIEKKLMREMIKPRLDVNYNVLSNNYTNNNFIFNSNNYKWGANISFPLFFRNPTNNYKMANIDLQNNSLELKLKQNEIVLKKDQIKKSISVLSQQLKNATKSVTYNKLLVDAERLKFDNGESSLFLLNTRENKLLETELKLAEYKLKFIKTVVNLIYLNGDLNYKL